MTQCPLEIFTLSIIYVYNLDIEVVEQPYGAPMGLLSSSSSQFREGELL